MMNLSQVVSDNYQNHINSMLLVTQNYILTNVSNFINYFIVVLKMGSDCCK